MARPIGSEIRGMGMKNIQSIQYDLQCAKEDYRYWCRIEGLLTDDERKEKERAFLRVKRLEKKLEKALGRCNVS